MCPISLKENGLILRRAIFLQRDWAFEDESIAALSIATRPDCLEDECIELLKRLNNIKPVWVELGLQTIHEDTAVFINRGYETKTYDETLERLKVAEIEVITHVILGLPGEDAAMMKETVVHVCDGGVSGIKLQLLHVLENTRLAEIFRKDPFHIMSLEEYGDLLAQLIQIIPPEVVIHRITGDPPKSLLIEPKWTADKKRVLNHLNHILSDP